MGGCDSESGWSGRKSLRERKGWVGLPLLTSDLGSNRELFTDKLE